MMLVRQGSSLCFEGASQRFLNLSRPYLSVVIPTYRRKNELYRVLHQLQRQIIQSQTLVEVIVCDDASNDGTAEWLKNFSARDVLPLAWIELAKNGGPARARNYGLRRARGEVVLFLGDDIEPTHGMIEYHAEWHRRHPEKDAALLGRTCWPPDFATDFMTFLENEGNSFFFDYKSLPAGQPVPGTKFYTCHVSLKRSMVNEVGEFDETFAYASHEDLEYGLRLEAAGMKLVYCPDVMAYHWHRLDLDTTIRRIYRMGVSSVQFWKLVDEKGGVSKRIARRVLSSCMRWRLTRRIANGMGRSGPFLKLQWWFMMHAVYWAGVYDRRSCMLNESFYSNTGVQ